MTVLGGKERLPPKRAVSRRDTPDIASAVVRLVRAVGNRVADDDPDSLDCLSQIQWGLDQAWVAAIAGLRRSGFTDRDIGRELGITRQAVEQRWPREA